MCLEAFYGGAAGGGKTDALLMAALQFVDVPGYSALLVRDTYKNLSMEGSLMDRAFDWLSGTDARWKEETKRWVFPSTATLSFGYLDGPRDHFNYQSSEFQMIGFDEIVGIRKNQAEYLFSRLRRKTPEAFRNELRTLPMFKNLKSKEIDLAYGMYCQVPLRYRAAGNPPTREQISRGSWVKDKYIDPSKREKGVVFIPAKLEDNPFVDKKEYDRSLKKLDETTYRQLRHGDWDINVEGLTFDVNKMWFFEHQSLSIRSGRTVCILDPAKGKKSGDFPAVVWGNMGGDNVLRVFDAIDEKMPLDEVLTIAAERNIAYGVREFVYEDNGTLLLDKVIEQKHREAAEKFFGRKAKYLLRIVSYTHRTNKDTRILGLQPILYNGTVMFRSDWVRAYPELMNQLRYYSPGEGAGWPNDDFPDVIEFLVWYFTTQGYSFLFIGPDGELSASNKSTLDVKTNSEVISSPALVGTAAELMEQMMMRDALMLRDDIGDEDLL